MKNYLFILGILIAIMIMIVGCDKKNDVPSPESNQEMILNDNGDPESFLLLVKFTDDKYREQIIAEHISDPVRMRGTTPPVIEELIVGTIPWAEKLSNGYWIADWRWGNSFIYPSTNVLLPDKWESLTHWTQTWPMPEKIIPFHDYIVEVGSARRRNIDKLLSLNNDVKSGTEEYFFLYSDPMVFGRGYMTKDDIEDFEKESYFTYVYQQDSLHAIYVQRLKDIITNDDFEKVYKRIFE